MIIDVLTLFPEMFRGPLDESMVKLGIEKGLFKINLINLRDFTFDRHKTADDRPFGGGSGMVLKPEPIFLAVEKLRKDNSKVILLCPQGIPLVQNKTQILSENKHLILICGHYEGIDERVRESLVDEEISIGDYILTNGELPAMVLIDSVVRLIPGVLGDPNSLKEESFSEKLLEYPQYTRPRKYKEMEVPDVLLSGNHEAIRQWRYDQAVKRTRERRPDLINDI